jgi:uroporphyrinogen-III synthase
MGLPDRQNARPTLLLTRPERQSRRFADQFRERFGTDWPVVMSPLMAVAFQTRLPSLSTFAGVIFSSENGVAAMGQARESFTGECYCVGHYTAEAAGQRGWDIVLAAPDSDRLAQGIIAAGCRGPLIHLHGHHVAGTLSQRLNSAGIDTYSQVVYDQIDRPPAAEAMALLALPAPVLAPLFSPRSAELFQQMAAQANAPLWVAALSPAVASALTLPVRRLAIAAKPDSSAMLDSLGALLQASA